MPLHLFFRKEKTRRSSPITPPTLLPQTPYASYVFSTDAYGRPTCSPIPFVREMTLGHWKNALSVTQSSQIDLKRYW
ncbi:hypothetical protein H5410_037106 [Solanum commersonii]|uniref:Uncharacterized protein n=1 Tax=Solanum commersonii TaxID=4109 RepID=A0A9J5Y731_SOLCO|nr:hypothetical protein H5410_037106 [Solanum commersonii]